MRDDPLIFAGRSVKRTKATPAGDSGTTDWDKAPPPEVTDQKGDLLIRDLWQNGTDNVNDMHVLNTYAKSHMAKTPEKCLQEAKRKKWKYLAACLQQSRHFSPFFASIDGLLGVESTATLKMLASRLATSGSNPT